MPSSGSGAGLNRIQSYLVPGLSSGATYDSGIRMCEGKNWTKWTFATEGTFDQYSIYVYGFVDSRITAIYWGQSGNNAYGQNYTGGPGAQAGFATSLFTASPGGGVGPFFLIASPSDQSGTGGIDQNPLTAPGQQLSAGRALSGVRVIVIPGGAPTGTVGLWGTASP